MRSRDWTHGTLATGAVKLVAVALLLTSCAAQQPQAQPVYFPHRAPAASKPPPLPPPAAAKIREIKKDIGKLEQKLDKRRGFEPIDWSEVPEAIP